VSKAQSSLGGPQATSLPWRSEQGLPSLRRKESRKKEIFIGKRENNNKGGGDEGEKVGTIMKLRGTDAKKRSLKKKKKWSLLKTLAGKRVRRGRNHCEIRQQGGKGLALIY